MWPLPSLNFQYASKPFALGSAPQRFSLISAGVSALLHTRHSEIRPLKYCLVSYPPQFWPRLSLENSITIEPVSSAAGFPSTYITPLLPSYTTEIMYHCIGLKPYANAPPSAPINWSELFGFPSSP